MTNLGRHQPGVTPYPRLIEKLKDLRKKMEDEEEADRFEDLAESS